MANLGYLEKYFTFSRIGDFQKAKLFPNLKEVTESMGILEACLLISDTQGIKRNNPNVKVIVVGDGHRPRTAALVASCTAWSSVSIDPALIIGNPFPKVESIKSKVEDIANDKLSYDIPVIVCFPHSHASMTTALGKIKAPIRHLVSLPCCVPDDIYNPDITYQDDNIMSKMNKVNIYLDR